MATNIHEHKDATIPSILFIDYTLNTTQIFQ